MLDCALFLIDQTNLNYQVRGSATHISRGISAIVNSSVCIDCHLFSISIYALIYNVLITTEDNYIS